MGEAPTVVGINRTQDASICLMHGSQLAWAIQKERLTRQKHHWGRAGDLSRIYMPRLPGLDDPIDVVVECFSSDAEFDKLAEYERELEGALLLSPGCRRVHISHHLAHLYSVFHPSPFEQAAVMVVDGQGSTVSSFTEAWHGSALAPGNWCEVSSFYQASRKRVHCIDKQVWNRDDNRLVGLGMFYFLLTQAIFPGHGNEGKVMGLAPHGKADALGLPPLDVLGCQVGIPARWREILRERRFRYSGADEPRFHDIANLAAAGQRAFEDALIEVACWLHRQTGADNLCFAGGTALNCSANERLLRETPFRRVFIPPAPSDAGTALGCAIYGLTEIAGQSCSYRWTNDYLGPEPARAEIDAALAHAADLQVEHISHPDHFAARLAELLCQGKVAGLFQGRSEFGPRALGHRSILGDPRHPHMRDWINHKVKQREWFRPLAPVVLLDHAGQFFDVPGASPFMQFAAPVHAKAARAVPAITHVDCTARLQTVGPGDDPFLFALLGAFHQRSGVPVLLNTSFNGKDEPIVETPAHARAGHAALPGAQAHRAGSGRVIRGYAASASVWPDEQLVLHIAGDAPQFRVCCYRCGDGLHPVFASHWLSGAAAADGAADHDWQWPAYTFRLPPGLPSGVYLAHLDTPGGPSPSLSMDQAAVLFVVRGHGLGQLLYKIPLATYNAYNHAGGACFYANPPRSIEPPGARLSFLRPGCGIGGPTFGAPDHYDPTSPRQTFAHWDARFIAWLERNGFEAEFCTDLDIDRDPALLDNYRLLLSVGHDEYWSTAMRDGVEQFIARGGNAAFFSANLCWWRIHLVDAGTAMVCHQGGPQGPRDQWWRAAGAKRPEDALAGVSYRHGGGWWDGARERAGFIVQDGAHWVFAGCGLADGAVFGARSRPPLVGYECDGAPLASAGGDRFLLAEAAPACGTPPGFHLLAACPLSERWQERPAREAGAGALHAATMGIIEGPGTVFTAATTDWAQVLGSGQDPAVDTITRNVLQTLLNARRS